MGGGGTILEKRGTFQPSMIFSSLTGRNNDGLDIRDLLHDLQAHRALTGENVGVVVAVDVHQSTVSSKFQRVFTTFSLCAMN